MKNLAILGIGVTTPKVHMTKVHMVLGTPKVFFTGEEKTTGNQGGGEREVRNDTRKKQSTVGIIGRRSGNKHNDKGVQTIIQINPGSNATTSVFRNYFAKNNNGSQRIHSNLVKKGDYQRNICSNKSKFLTNLHATEKEREKATNYRSVNPEPSFRLPFIQNGDRLRNCKSDFDGFMGVFHRYSGCLLPRPNELGVPQISGFQNRKPDFCIPVSPFRSVSSTLGLHQDHQANKIKASHSNDPYFQLPGRLHPLRRNCSSAVRLDEDNVGVTSESRICHKLGKVISKPSPRSGIPRCLLGSEERDIVRSAGEEESNRRSLPCSPEREQRLSTLTGKSCGLAELRSILCSTGKTPSPSDNCLDELKHSLLQQGHSSSSDSSLQKLGQNLDKPRVSVPVCSYEHLASRHINDDRCIIGRLVRSSASSQGPRHLVPRRSAQLNELEGTNGGLLISAEVQVDVEREDCPSPFGQHYNSVLSEETRFAKVRKTTLPHNVDSGILQNEQNHIGSGTSERRDECTGGPRFEIETGFDRMDSRPNNIQSNSGNVPGASSRPFCNPVQRSTQNVCISVSRRSSGRLRCLRPRLGSVEVDLPLSSQECTPSSRPTTTRLQRKRRPPRSILAESELVPHIVESVQIGSVQATESAHPVTNDSTRSNVGRHRVLEPSRLATVVKGFLKDKASDDTISIIKKAHADSSLKQYQSIWGKFLDFLDANSISHDRVGIADVMNFLSYHAIQFKREYRTIAAYKCAVKLPFKLVLGIDFGGTELGLFMRGLFNTKPPRKCAPMPTWYLDILFEYLNSDRFEPLGSKDISIIQQKLLVLLLLATGRRIGEVAHLALKYESAISGNWIRLFWLEGYKPKHCTKDFSPKLPLFNALESEIPTDFKLCPKRAFIIYVSLRKRSISHPSTKDPLWLLDTQGLSKLFKATVFQSRHRVQMMDNISIGPHHMRKLAASYSAVLMGDSRGLERVLMDRMGYKSMKVLKKNYISNVPDLKFKCVVPVGTYSP